jgi:hypothetical protein
MAGTGWMEEFRAGEDLEKRQTADSWGRLHHGSPAAQPSPNAFMRACISVTAVVGLGVAGRGAKVVERKARGGATEGGGVARWNFWWPGGCLAVEFLTGVGIELG